jgi:ABC-type multidrug transport system ATPase subunit
MSEEILKALTQLYAIITKQDGGVTENERAFVIGIFREDLDRDSIEEYLRLYDEYVGYGKTESRVGDKGARKLTSVKDSVRTLAICRKINKTLTQKQKVVVLIKLLQLVGSDRKLTSQRMEIINTVADVFNISQQEYELIKSFVLHEKGAPLDHQDLLLASSSATPPGTQTKVMEVDMHGELLFLLVRSVDMYFVRYHGSQEILLNGFAVKPDSVSQFSHGSTIKMPSGDALYYSDLVQHFSTAINTVQISFKAECLFKKFPNGQVGLRNVHIDETQGKLIGIMGASGAGKTTLLNVLSGVEKPTSGTIRINGIDLFSRDTEKIKGLIGYISQDDLLIEELSVFENLYFNARLCFANLTEEQIRQKVMQMLNSLGLDQRKDLKVGSVFDKKLSGGQRKRLNIALELIREPSVLFVDEPTSGLSSRDSENVIDLLKELSLKGKLVFVVIHQPSSDIYKMFDKMIIMDVGGYPVYDGPPVEAVTWFKRAINHVNAEKGLCSECGNVNPEQIFNIVDAKVVDEYGEFTAKRKIEPEQWHRMFEESRKPGNAREIKRLPPLSLKIPGRIRQLLIFARRDFLSKLSNRQYMLINVLEAPVLAFVLAFIIRYKSGPGGTYYMYRFNENIPVYLMMAIIVALFMGLTVSAEEIIKDRKILKREKFLNLSRNSYFLSKVLILFGLSAVQTLLFVLVGNSILEIKGMFLPYWLALFTVSCTANVMGLNISSAFNSAVTVYILIPLLIIPQMVLSGLLFKFDKLNELISTKGKVPIVADLMASRWAYEALAVEQFKGNRYQAPYYRFDQQASQADYMTTYWVEEVKKRVAQLQDPQRYQVSDERVDQLQALVRNEMEEKIVLAGMDTRLLPRGLYNDNFTTATADSLAVLLDRMHRTFLDAFTLAQQKKERLTYHYETNGDDGFDIDVIKNTCYNESLADLVRNIDEKDRIVEYKGKLIQQIDPIYYTTAGAHLLDYRTHFFAPVKQFMGIAMDTFPFNLLVIWLMTFVLYIALYFEWLKKVVAGLDIPVRRGK